MAHRQPAHPDHRVRSQQTPDTRPGRRSACLAALSLLAAGFTMKSTAQTPPEQVLQLTARRFFYTPKELSVKAGMAVRLEITSVDFFHGFFIPDLKIRTDLPPGQITVVRFTAPTPGTLPFLCDNFCGDGHEQMGGKIVVVA